LLPDSTAWTAIPSGVITYFALSSHPLFEVEEPSVPLSQREKAALPSQFEKVIRTYVVAADPD
jgi:hypothetical protein